jgi:5-dehydro-2-deoxygluconokinase
MARWRRAREAGSRTVLDVDLPGQLLPSPPPPASRRADARSWTWSWASEDEIALLTGEPDARRQVTAVLQAGAGLLVRKLGARGVETHTSAESTAVPPVPVHVVSTIGAGDAFAAGFLDGLHRGRPLAECLRAGNAAAAIVVGRVSCSDAMPYRHELEEILRTAPGPG